jgi:hypothetical protein
MVAQTPSLGGSSSDPHDEASSSAHIYMFNGINLTTHSKTYDTLGNPNKGKDTNDTGNYWIHHHPLLVFHRLILHLDHSRLRNPHLTLSYSLLRALYVKLPLILVHVPPKTTILLNIWLKHYVLCLR